MSTVTARPARSSPRASSTVEFQPSSSSSTRIPDRTTVLSQVVTTHGIWVLVQALGVPGAVAIDGVSFMASALGIALVQAPEPAPPARGARRRLDVELVEGLRTLTGHHGRVSVEDRSAAGPRAA